MIFRQLHFKKAGAFILIFILYQNQVSSQILHSSDSSGSKRFLPDYLKVQFAGGTGFISAGIGYSFPKQHIDVSVIYGNVPKFISTDLLHIVSFQVSGNILKYKIKNKFEFYPLDIGFIIHQNFGSGFWTKLPSYYPDKYYWWSPGLSSGLIWDIGLKTKVFNNSKLASGTTFYIHLETGGLYLTSKYGNSSLPLREIIDFGIGIKVYR